MDDNRQKQTAEGRRAVNLFALRAAVAAYLVYLGFDLFRAYLAGASTLSPTMAWLCGPGFMAAGLGFGVYSYLRYRREKAAAPEGQSDAADEPEEKTGEE